MTKNNTDFENKNNFEEDYQMLKYFQDEFMYRHKHFWDLSTKTFILVIAITIIPIVSESFGFVFNDRVQDFLITFPVFGILLAIGSFFVLLDEGKKIESVNIAKYQLNLRMNERYHYVFYNKLSGNKFRNEKSNRGKWPLDRIITMLVFFIEIIIALFVFMTIASSLICITDK